MKIEVYVCESELPSNNYVYVEPNSQFFTDLEQIREYLRIKSDDEYLKIAIENTIKKGYKLIRK